MSDVRKRLGAFGEAAARRYIEGLGYRVLHTNYRCPLGEIDIVAKHGRALVFVEVRTRRGDAFGTPEESVTSAKRAKLIALADHYVQKLPAPPDEWRIDVVAVELGTNGRIRRMEHIVNAID